MQLVFVHDSFKIRNQKAMRHIILIQIEKHPRFKSNFPFKAISAVFLSFSFWIALKHLQFQRDLKPEKINFENLTRGSCQKSW